MTVNHRVACSSHATGAMKKSTGRIFKVAVVATLVVAIVVAIPFAVVKLATRKKK